MAPDSGWGLLRALGQFDIRQGGRAGIENVAVLPSELQAPIQVGMELRGEGADHKAAVETECGDGIQLRRKPGGISKGRCHSHCVGMRHKLAARFGVIAVPGRSRRDRGGQIPFPRRRRGARR